MEALLGEKPQNFLPPLTRLTFYYSKEGKNLSSLPFQSYSTVIQQANIMPLLASTLGLTVPEYGYVLAVGISASLVNFWHGLVVSKARKEAGIAYPSTSDPPSLVYSQRLI